MASVWSRPGLCSLVLIVLACAVTLVGFFENISAASTLTVVPRAFSGAAAFALNDFENPPSLNQSLHRRAEEEDYTCGANRPCRNGACCGKENVCGYGPDYCGTGCQSNCDAKAECGRYAKAGDERCPLNVCCSQHGFCGTQPDYCGQGCQNNCGTPSVPPGGSNIPVRKNKVIAYYESWAARRQCKLFTPSNIPTSSLTHVNYAFAYISTGSYDIITMDSATPEYLFRDTAAIKNMNGGSPIEVFIATGGWTFSDNGTVTQPLFGELSRTEANRQRFADNCVRFMKRYGFDGVDLDWEYPGATDRGGKPDDKANLVALVKTMRRTFDAAGSYGLTFTIPSSYWYLRHFDVPGMISAGADWVNLMSYDLHGVWDEHNPIGNVILGHTNLTEIKQSTELLWRNNVPPGKVVLGTGFYGRAFQLSNRACNTPGCEFKGASRKGPCTGEAGILGYFEIQDILARQGSNANVVHDTAAAVKYLTYNEDQWISFDDAETFEQKVDWADSVGLGGLMIWAIDMDDKEFSALSGLLGVLTPSLPPITDAKDTIENDSWASENGEDCVPTRCGGSCPRGYNAITEYKSNCGAGKKKLCCPQDRTPRDCAWRSGESSGGSGKCNGQCGTGELTLVTDSNGDRQCLTGEQAFCCTSDRFSAIAGKCSLSECGASCRTGLVQVALQYDVGTCHAAGWGGFRAWCCEEALQNCRWKGEGSCYDNKCDQDQFQLSLSEYGGNTRRCYVPGRKKSLCCDAPYGGAFPPVDLAYIFPDPPDQKSPPVSFNLRPMGLDTGKSPTTTPRTDDPNSDGFGFVLITGPNDVVASFSKRDQSHIEFLDCGSINSSERQTTRILCTEDGDSSNCDDVFEGGLEGTVVRFPDNCGPGQWAVAHSLVKSENQALPAYLQSRKPLNRSVMDFEFSFDFSLIKRASEPVQFRVDYSNQPGYWDAIVDEPGERIPKRLNKRFFSYNSNSWTDKFDEIEKNSKTSTTFKMDFNRPIFASKEVCGKDGFLEIKPDGVMTAEARWGYSFIGTLQPFNIHQAHGFLSWRFDFDASVNVKANVAVDTLGGILRQVMSDGDLHGPTFTHPGIVSFDPTANIYVEFAGNSSFSGDFRSHFHTGSSPDSNNGWVRYTYPEAPGSTSGGHRTYPVDDPFDGYMHVDNGQVKLTAYPSLNMNMDFGQAAGTDSITRRQSNEPFFGYVTGVEAPTWLEWNQEEMSIEHNFLLVQNSRYGNGKIDAFGDGDKSPKFVGSQPKGNTHELGPLGSDETIPDPPVSNALDSLFSGSRVLTCPIGEDGRPKCYADLCALQTIDNCDEDPAGAGRPRRAGTRKARRHGFAKFNATTLSNIAPKIFKREPHYPIRGGSRQEHGTCKNNNDNEIGVTYTTLPYPNHRDWMPDYEIYDHAYDAYDERDCSDGRILGQILTYDYPRKFCTEHIMELQTLGLFFRDVTRNELADGSGSGFTQIRCDFVNDFLKTAQLDTNGLPLPAGSTTQETNPMKRLMIAHGEGYENWRGFVLLQQAINGVKAKIWRGNNPVRDDKRRDINNSRSRFNEGLVSIRTIINVFNYLNDPVVHGHLVDQFRAIRSEFRFADEAWAKAGNRRTFIGDYWEDWFDTHLSRMAFDSNRFASRSWDEMRAFWLRQPNDDTKLLVLQHLYRLEPQLDQIALRTDGFH